MSMFWEMRQSYEIGKARAQASAGASKASQASQEVRDLEDRLDRLTLVSMAMWSLLKEKNNMTEEELLLRVRQIDLADGEEDGKVKRKVLRCPRCSRVMSPRHRKCMYCGSSKLSVSAFDATM